jgi:hypothetical protein
MSKPTNLCVPKCTSGITTTKLLCISLPSHTTDVTGDFIALLRLAANDFNYEMFMCMPGDGIENLILYVDQNTIDEGLEQKWKNVNPDLNILKVFVSSPGNGDVDGLIMHTSNITDKITEWIVEYCDLE